MKRTLLALSAFALGCMTTMNAQQFLRLKNGQIIPISNIKKMEMLSIEDPEAITNLLEKDDSISLYVGALNLTGVMDMLKCYKDDTYKWATEQDRLDSCTWSNDRLCIFGEAEYHNVAYPEKRLYSFTVFTVKDKDLKEKYGITKLLGKDDPSSLEYHAHKIYDEVYPEDAGINDYKNRKNALNRFISYHVLDRYGSYNGLTAMDGNNLQNNFDRKKLDIADWYETLMPNSLMKISYPLIAQNRGLYINRRGVQDRADARGVFNRGSLVKMAPKEHDGVNGIYYYIDEIADYGKNTQNVVLNERMRIDATTLSPDFMTKMTDGETARGHHKKYGETLYYGSQYNGYDAQNNPNREIVFKNRYVRNFEMNDGNNIMLLSNRYLSFWNYQGDNLIFKGSFKTKIKLPSLPAGKYELRLGTVIGFTSAGKVQFAIDGENAGEAVNFAINATESFGYQNDTKLGSDEAIDAFDKEIRAKGWMKGPKGYASGDRSSAVQISYTLRDCSDAVRKIIGTFTTDGKSDHYLSFQSVGLCLLDFDYIEIVPEDVYNNENYPEDKY